jgi:hypothetical protein
VNTDILPFRLFRHHGIPSVIAASHFLCLTHLKGRSVVITAISMGPPQIWARLENFIAFIVLAIHAWVKSMASRMGRYSVANCSRPWRRRRARPRLGLTAERRGQKILPRHLKPSPSSAFPRSNRLSRRRPW